MPGPASTVTRSRRRIRAALTGVAVLASSVAMVGPASADTDACAAMSAPVYNRADPGSEASILTTSATDIGAYTEDLGTSFAVATDAGAGLTEIRELTRDQPGDNVYIKLSHEASTAVDKYGYTDEGVAFYASETPLPCTVPVYRYRQGTVHRFSTSDAQGAGANLAGWEFEGIALYAVASDGGVTPPPTPPPGTDTKFSIAVMPDTQQETGRDGRFLNRTTWLAAHSGANDLDLRFVTHTGDVVNWDTPDHLQYQVASAAMVPLQLAGIPYSLSIGNHDSQATGPGGAARDSHNTRALMRDTSTFNSFFTARRYGDVDGAFEAGKVDNIWSEFKAGGASWMVLNLELWPRVEVVNWARQVVADHPNDNVLVVTHSYLEGNLQISQNSEYGATSPQYLFDHLISQYANIKMVFSGHVGVAGSRVDTGVNGNKIYSFLAAIHSNTTNPVRILTIDTGAGKVSTTIVAPWNNARTWKKYDQTFSGVKFVG